MTAGYTLAISRQVCPSVTCNFPPSPVRGRRECRAPDAPAAARGVVVNTRVSHHGHTGNTRHSPRNGFTAYFALSPVTGLSCHCRQRNRFRQLDASVGVSGPHDFAVRLKRHSSKAPSASTASRPTSVTIAKRPSVGTGPNQNIAVSTGPSSAISENQKLAAVRRKGLLHKKSSYPANGSRECAPDDRLQRGIQYAGTYRFHRLRLWNTGSPAFAGDDEGWYARTPRILTYFIFSNSKDSNRHCERSEAIHAATSTARMDCFVAEPVIGRAFARPVGSSQ